MALPSPFGFELLGRVFRAQKIKPGFVGRDSGREWAKEVGLDVGSGVRYRSVENDSNLTRIALVPDQVIAGREVAVPAVALIAALEVIGSVDPNQTSHAAHGSPYLRRAQDGEAGSKLAQSTVSIVLAHTLIPSARITRRIVAGFFVSAPQVNFG